MFEQLSKSLGEIVKADEGKVFDIELHACMRMQEKSDAQNVAMKAASNTLTTQPCTCRCPLSNAQNATTPLKSSGGKDFIIRSIKMII